MTDTSQALKPAIIFLQHHEPYRLMSATHQEYLAMHLEQVFFATSDIILSSQQGVIDYFYIIKSGLVSAENNIDNGSIKDDPMTVLEPGDSFPIPALQNERAVFFQHRALKSTICYKLKLRHFEYLMQQSHRFHEFITNTK